MVPDPTKTSLGLEYFCTEGDTVWTMSDTKPIEMGRQEIDRIGLASAEDVVDGCVVRVEKAYPVYNSDYREHLGVVREFIEGLENCQTIGRNGLHRYNNQDHAMLTGMLAARNVALSERNDLWSVNVDQEYQEEVRAEPEELERTMERALTLVFNKLDRIAFGLAVGTVGALALGAATLAGALAGESETVIWLWLLGQYLPGYRVDATGSLLGLLYGGAGGFAAGWLFASARNAALGLYLSMVYRRSEKRGLARLFDQFF
jgi:hypothetical protein